MSKYYKYFLHILRHKKNVFKECWKEGLYVHAFTHDLSKFSFKDFIARANYLYDNEPINKRDKYVEALRYHNNHNKHHWQYWKGDPIPMKYLKQMVCDWKAECEEMGTTPQLYYYRNYDRIKLDNRTRVQLEYELGFLGEEIVFNIPWKILCAMSEISMEDDMKRLGFMEKE